MVELLGHSLIQLCKTHNDATVKLLREVYFLWDSDVCGVEVSVCVLSSYVTLHSVFCWYWYFDSTSDIVCKAQGEAAP